MDIKESATINAENFTTEQVTDFFDGTAKRYREALKLSHMHKGTPNRRNSSGIIILQNNDEVEISAFGSEITLNDVILNVLISRATEADTDDVAALLMTFAGKMLESALEIGNFTDKALCLAILYAANALSRIIRKTGLIEDLDDECPTD
ncbi:MAG: hypothetical protein ACI4HN_04685 [Ruminococcus sp.]